MSSTATSNLASLPVTLDDVLAAKRRIHGYCHRTPAFPSRTLSKLIGARVWLKCENLQVGGAFKARGAYNKIARLSPLERQRGVITFSSGNHAQGVARAAQSLAIPCVVVMPLDAPVTKLNATRDTYRAEVVLCGTTSDERRREAEKIARERGMTMIPPFDDEDIVAGQGTVGLEILEDLPEVDAIVIPVGGGGLLSGVAVAVKSQHPHVQIIGVEPTNACAMAKSVEAGQVVAMQPGPTIADGLKPVAPGHIPFIIARELVDRMVQVDDAAIMRATNLLHSRAKLVVEASGAAGVAWLLQARDPSLFDKTIAVILSGGNIDPALYANMTEPARADVQLFDD